MPKLNLEKELDHMFREDLIVACQYWGVDVSTSQSGESFSKMLAERMRNDEYRERMFQTFTPREIDLLGILALSGGAMSYDRLKPFRKLYSYGQLNQTEKDLRKKGIIIRRMMSRLTDTGREVAEFKILEFFLPHLVEYFTARPKPDPAKPEKARNFVDKRDTILVDMLLLVSYLAKNEVNMTSAWEFPKREAEHIQEAMSKSTEDRFERVQKLTRKAGAYRIVEEDRVIPGNITALFEGRQDVVSRRLLLSSLGRTRAIWATPDQPTEYTLNLAICRLRQATQEEWISIQEMRDWIRSELFSENQPLKWIQVDEERVRMAMETPILLGLLEGAYKGKKLLGVRLTQVGESVISSEELTEVDSNETFFVQPNFEVTVYTSEMNYHKLYQLMLFTEPVKTDVVSTFRITDKSIFQSIELGYRDHEILEFLETESSKPIPKNVSRSIADWTSQTTFATVSSVTLFETESERDLEDLMLIEDFKSNVVRQIGQTAAVMKGDSETLIEDLKRHKVHIRQSGREVVASPPSDKAGVAEQMLLYGDQTAVDAPDDCIGCPALQSCNKVIRRKTRPVR
ncbi:MAG: helicase-associated domain-containing protein [Candidatus Thorarchaeota archaeon]|jgi:hypothetical protein